MEDNYKEGFYMENLCDTIVGFVVGAMLAFTYRDRGLNPLFLFSHILMYMYQS